MEILYGIDSKGRIRQWQVNTFENPDGTATIRREYGLVGKKITQKDQIIKKGKNIGKANETTPIQQAEFQAASEFNSKVHENYVSYIPDPATFEPPFILPMLAKPKGKIKFPCYIQPKLNGICDMGRRCAADEIIHHSRGGQIFEFIEHLNPFIHEINQPNELVHGELYNHDWSLQKIGSCVKKRQEYNTDLELWVYDCAAWVNGRPLVGATFKKRFVEDFTEKYNALGGDSHVKLTPTFLINSYEEGKEYHDEWVLQGFEGAILKNENGIYIFQYRSDDIEKMKEYQDAEFEIIGGKEDVDGCCVFRCVTKDGKEFDVRPKGSVQKRKQYLEELDDIVAKGRPLTVKFFEWSDDRVPLQPVGVVIRDYE